MWYGEGTYDGRRTMILSDIGGANLYAEQFRHLDEATFKERLQPAIRDMLKLGVEPADTNPRNYHIVGDAGFVIDLEDTVEADPERVEELADAVPEAVAHWAMFYHGNNGSQAAAV